VVQKTVFFRIQNPIEIFQGWRHKVLTMTTPRTTIFLVGNKVDLMDANPAFKTNRSKAKSFHDLYGSELDFDSWRLTSAKDGTGVRETFDDLIEMILVVFWFFFCGVFF